MQKKNILNERITAPQTIVRFASVAWYEADEELQPQ